MTRVVATAQVLLSLALCYFVLDIEMQFCLIIALLSGIFALQIGKDKKGD